MLALQEASAIAMADSFAQVTAMPKPWVKWSYEPARAQDVPEAFMRAHAVALRPPAGPVYLSIPLDDWNQPLASPARVRTVSDRVAPAPTVIVVRTQPQKAML